MRKGLHLIFTILLVLLVFGSGFTAVKDTKGSIKPYIYIEKGMKHNLVVMNDAATGKKAIVDTIEHFFYGDPANDWNEIFHDYASALDTTVNWFGLAADSATVIGILSSFYTSGTGSWDVWYSDGGAPGLPGLLPFSLPWSVTADTLAGGIPSGNMQYLDIEGQVGGINVKPDTSTGQLHGVFAGFIRDGNAGPQIYSDEGGHYYDDPVPWYNALSTLSGLGTGWYRYGNDFYWFEFTMSLVVRYEALAPLLENITQLADYFAGSTDDKTIYADIVDLDGTIQTAELKYQIRGSAIVSTDAMTLVSGDTYSTGFSISFSAGDTVDYWIEATDNEGNFRSADAGTFALIAPPAVGTDVLFVVDAGDGGEALFEQSLVNLTKDHYVWNAGVHGGISSYEINYGFNNIVWYGYGSPNMSSPFETGSNAMATYLDNGGYLMLVDKDYLYGHGYTNETLVAGEFAYDYLGMLDGESDPQATDTVDTNTLNNGFKFLRDSTDTLTGSWNLRELKEGGFNLNEDIKPGEDYRFILETKLINSIWGDTLLDTVYNHIFSTASTDEFGSISGKVLIDSIRYSQLYLSTVPVKNKKQSFGVTKFNKNKFKIDWLLEGYYIFKGFFDLDKNQKWSPGKIEPFQYAEPIFVKDDTIRVRKRWETSDLIIQFED